MRSDSIRLIKNWWNLNEKCYIRSCPCGWAKKVQFSCLALCFCCASVTFSDISPADKWSFLLRPLMGFIDLGSWKPYLWNIILAPISHPIGIFFLPLCIPSTYNGTWNTESIQYNICWINDPEDSRLGVWSCGQPYPTFLVTEEQRKEETKETWREIWKVRIWAESPTKLQTILIEYISLSVLILPSEH